MRAYLETLPWTAQSSLAWLDRALDDGIPFQWHHHPEWELTLTLNSVGQRFIGDHVGEYGQGDLVLVGPNLPHTWVSRDRLADGPHRAKVIWFKQDWLDRFVGLPEWSALGRLAARGKGGLAFDHQIAALAEPLVAAFFDSPPQERFLMLLRLLSLLGDAGEPLATSVPETQGGDRIDRVLIHLHNSFAEPIRIKELANIAALSQSGLHRMFKRQTGVTVTDYIIRLRIGAAAARLAGSDTPIANIAADVGYNALANFNRQFRAALGITPRDYRARFRS